MPVKRPCFLQQKILNNIGEGFRLLFHSFDFHLKVYKTFSTIFVYALFDCSDELPV